MKYLLIIASIMLCGCSASMTYKEMNEAYEMAATPEEKKIAEERLDEFEETVRKTDLYFEERDRCESTTGYMWYCYNVQSTDMRRIKTIDARVRAYRRKHSYCQCASEKEVMDSMQDLGYFY